MSQQVLVSQRVLVVEDNADGARSLAMLLTCHGREVRVAPDGETALAAIEEFEPQIVVLDIGLPDMDGYEIARRIRNDFRRRMTLIAMSGFTAERDERGAAFDHFLVKPIDIEKLLAIL